MLVSSGDNEGRLRSFVNQRKCIISCVLREACRVGFGIEQDPNAHAGDQQVICTSNRSVQGCETAAFNCRVTIKEARFYGKNRRSNSVCRYFERRARII